MTLIGRRPLGGCDFPVDPNLEAPAAPVFWNPADAPTVVHLIAPVPDVGLQVDAFTEPIVQQRIDDRGHAWRRLHGGAVLIGAADDLYAHPFGVLIPFDEHWPVRIAAAERLRRELIGGGADPPLTPLRRERLKQALRCIDARRQGASYRAVATVFFGARRVAEEPWKTSSLKAQVIRLAAHGRILIDHGYRQILQGRLR